MSYLLNILVHYCQEVDTVMLCVTVGRKPRVSIKINWEFRMREHSCIINGGIYGLIFDEFIVQRYLILWSMETTFIFQRLKDLWKRRALSPLSVNKGVPCIPTPQFMISVQDDKEKEGWVQWVIKSACYFQESERRKLPASKFYTKWYMCVCVWWGGRLCLWKADGNSLAEI